MWSTGSHNFSKSIEISKNYASKNVKNEHLTLKVILFIIKQTLI